MSNVYRQSCWSEKVAKGRSTTVLLHPFLLCWCQTAQTFLAAGQMFFYIYNSDLLEKQKRSKLYFVFYLECGRLNFDLWPGACIIKRSQCFIHLPFELNSDFPASRSLFTFKMKWIIMVTQSFMANLLQDGLTSAIARPLTNQITGRNVSSSYRILTWT